MNLEKIIVTTLGGALASLIVWFFFGQRDNVGPNTNTITVSGGYQPKHIAVKNNSKTTLTFIRTDSNSCLEEVVIPDFGIKRYLPLNVPVAISIYPKKAGKYTVHCGMNMFSATIEVV